MQKKTKVMAISKEGNETLNIKLNGKDLEQVKSFTYVGGEISSDGRVTEDIKRRIAKGLQTMGAINVADLESERNSNFNKGLGV